MNVDLMVRNWQTLIRPRRIDIEDNLSATYGRFECAPLERGFGLTLGNALRRVLLSSLQGSAITSVRIEGVQHEFSSIPGVLEDVTDVVLNLKEVRLRSHSAEPKQIVIKKSGGGAVTASDFTSPDQTVEILEGHRHIATLSGDGELSLTATVETGKGFVLAEKNAKEDQPIGTIPIDSIFSPVRKVNYTVTNARVGRETDYDRLSMEIWTDGSVAPADALAFAAKILKDQLSIFINFEEDVERPYAPAIHSVTPNEILFRPGRRARAVGALGQLPAERRHQVHRRARAAQRGRDAQDQELRAQVAERDQGDPRGSRPRVRHEARELPVAQGAGPLARGRRRLAERG